MRSSRDLATLATLVGLSIVVALVLSLHPIADATALLLARGARMVTVERLVMVPIGVLAIVFGRTFIGLETFGVMGPLILGFAFERMGTLVGLAVFVALLTLLTPIRLLLEHVAILTVARTGMLVTTCALLLLAVMAYGATLAPELATMEIALPVVTMAGMVDRFVTAQMDQSPKEAWKLSVHTLVTAGLVGLLVSADPVREAMTEHPDLVVLSLPAGLLLGRYRGLRLVERFRFRVVPSEEAP